MAPITISGETESTKKGTSLVTITTTTSAIKGKIKIRPPSNMDHSFDFSWKKNNQRKDGGRDQEHELANFANPENPNTSRNQRLVFKNSAVPRKFVNVNILFKAYSWIKRETSKPFQNHLILSLMSPINSHQKRMSSTSASLQKPPKVLIPTAV